MDKLRRFKLGTAGFQAGMLEKIAFNMESIKKHWKELRPRTQHALMGAGLGAIPGSLYGLLRSDEDTRKSMLSNILTSGAFGGLLGGGAGYMMPLNPQELMTQLGKIKDETEQQTKAKADLLKLLEKEVATSTPWKQMQLGMADIFGYPRLPKRLQTALQAYHSAINE